MLKTANARRATLLAALFSAGLLFAGVARAQTGDAAAYPTKPIKFILPNSPGSLVDFVARTVAEGLTKRLGQPIVVDNQAGAGGVAGTAQLARADKDGYTLGVVATNHVILPNLYKLPYDPAHDLVPVTVIGTSPMVLVVSPKVQAKNLQELLAAARAKPGQMTYGSAGIGTTGHLSAELMTRMTKTSWLHVPYKGQNTFTTDVLGGVVDIGFFTATVAAPLVKSGKLRAIAITTPKRSGVLPDVPTFAEAGVPGYSIDAWVAMLAPAGTPPAVIKKLRDETDAVLKGKDVQDKLREQAVDIVSSTPEAAATTVNGDLAKYRQIVRDAGIKPE